MKINHLAALSVLASLGGGCTLAPVTGSPSVSAVANSALPDCFNSNYDKDRNLFTMKDVVANQVNQQCSLTVGPRGTTASASRFAAGSYSALLSDGGGGGAGGTLQTNTTAGGGGGGGGAGAPVQRATLELSEGEYRLTIGAGGRGGSACIPRQFGGGPGWRGSPSNIVRVASAEVVMGTPGAETFKALTRAQNDRAGGITDGHGGSGPMHTTGGRGGAETMDGDNKDATPGASAVASGRVVRGGAAGTDTADKSRSGSGGGGGATPAGIGGSGGGETTTATLSSSGKARVSQAVLILPAPGALGSGGGGGEGSSVACEAGAAGGHGFISLRRL